MFSVNDLVALGLAKKSAALGAMCNVGDSAVTYASNGLIYDLGIPRELPPQRTPFNAPARVAHHVDQLPRVGVGVDVSRGVVFFTLDGKVKCKYGFRLWSHAFSRPKLTPKNQMWIWHGSVASDPRKSRLFDPAATKTFGSV